MSCSGPRILPRASGRRRGFRFWSCISGSARRPMTAPSAPIVIAPLVHSAWIEAPTCKLHPMKVFVPQTRKAKCHSNRESGRTTVVDGPLMMRGSNHVRTTDARRVARIMGKLRSARPKISRICRAKLAMWQRTPARFMEIFSEKCTTELRRSQGSGRLDGPRWPSRDVGQAPAAARHRQTRAAFSAARHATQPCN